MSGTGTRREFFKGVGFASVSALIAAGKVAHEESCLFNDAIRHATEITALKKLRTVELERLLAEGGPELSLNMGWERRAIWSILVDRKQGKMS